MTAVDIGRAACGALLDEVNATPKPGLVDCANSGAHRDMDINTFFISVTALAPHFTRFAALGAQTANLQPAAAFRELRGPGIEAEGDMLAATGGVNTHKGAIFSLGLMCAACARLAENEAHVSAAQICREAARMADGVTSELKKSAAIPSHGQAAFEKYGVMGARGEAENGFPGVMEVGYPTFNALMLEGAGKNAAAVWTLVALMGRVTDTNVISRHDMGMALALKAWALELGPRPSIQAISAFDKSLIALNISPGGCADLLAATIFLHSIEEINMNKQRF